MEGDAGERALFRLKDGYLAAGEAGVDQLARLSMLRWVGVEQVALEHRVL